MEITIQRLIDSLLEAKRLTRFGGEATIYIGKEDGSGAEESNLCLCAEETYKGVNIPLFKIVGDNLILNEALATDRFNADKHLEEETK